LKNIWQNNIINSGFASTEVEAVYEAGRPKLEKKMCLRVLPCVQQINMEKLARASQATGWVTGDTLPAPRVLGLGGARD
jgi:hypothetical protein